MMDWLPNVALALLTLLGLQSPESERRYHAIDGDTFQAGMEIIRISNIDAPEIKSCAHDKAMEAKRLAQTMLDRHVVTISRQGKDQYGRTLAAVAVDGADLGDWLVASGVARRWTGTRKPWC